MRQLAKHGPAPSTGERGRLVELDGLRGGAAVAVVVAHYFGEAEHGFRALTFAWIGVGVFFVLSGYLIGSIVLRECDESGFLGKFYLRRAARILPVYLITVLATYAALGMLSGKPYVESPLPLATYLTFTQNMAMPFVGEGSRWLLPTWTLAVEEQFYLILPLVVTLVPRRRLAEAFALACLAALTYRVAVHGHNSLAALTPLPARADMLLAGVLAAIAQQRLNLANHIRSLRIAALACIILLLAITVFSTEAGSVVAPTLLGAGTACFILAIVHGAPEAQRFTGPKLRALGAISYALYLVHQPVNGLLHGLVLGARPDVGSLEGISLTFLAVAVSLGLAGISRIVLEAPLLAWARRATARPSPVLQGGRA